MKLDEANKIIAEYMGYIYYKPGDTIYNKSLDALIPVWEKAENSNDPYFTISIARDILREAMYTEEFLNGEIDTMQEAVCLATAKAIKDLL